MGDILEEIATTFGELTDSEKMKGLVKEALSQRIPVTEIVERGLRRGLEIVGKRYEANEYFTAELLFAGYIMDETLETLRPHLELERVRKKGTVVLGTVRGDIHDIGKDIFKMLAEASGFEVFDLGVDVWPEVFVEKLKETNAEILGLSALLTTTIPEMKTVIDELEKAGTRKGVKILLGGNAVTKGYAREIGADAAALNAMEGVEICERWVEER